MGQERVAPFGGQQEFCAGLQFRGIETQEQRRLLPVNAFECFARARRLWQKRVLPQAGFRGAHGLNGKQARQRRRVRRQIEAPATLRGELAKERGVLVLFGSQCDHGDCDPARKHCRRQIEG